MTQANIAALNCLLTKAEMNKVSESYYLNDDYALLLYIDPACGMDMDVTHGLADGALVLTLTSVGDDRIVIEPWWPLSPSQGCIGEMRANMRTPEVFEQV